MKKMTLFLLLLGLGMAPSLFAESWEGQVKSVPTDGKSVVVKKMDPQNGKKSKEDYTVQISPQTELTGIDSLKDLRSGDVLEINAEKEKGNLYKAASIAISKVDIKEVH